MKRVVFVLLLILTVSSIAAQDDEWYVGKVIKDFSFDFLERVCLTDSSSLHRSTFYHGSFLGGSGKTFCTGFF